jgi:hypothetical protein
MAETFMAEGAGVGFDWVGFSLSSLGYSAFLL